MIWKNYVKRTSFDSYSDFYNNFDYNLPEHFNFTEDVVLKRCEMNPDKIAIIYVNDKNQRKHLTYFELDFLIRFYTFSLYQQGIRQGDKIIVQLGRDYNFIPFVLAIVRLGAVACPTPTIISKNDLKKRIDELKPKMVIDKKFLDKINKEFEVDTLITPEIPIDLEYKEMFIYYTSGSYGESKKVSHIHFLPLSFIANGKYMVDFSEDDIVYNFAETGWAAYLFSFFCQFWFGYTTLIYDFNKTPDFKKFVDIADEYKLTKFFCSPGILFSLSHNNDISDTSLSTVNKVISAGGILHYELYKNFIDKFKNVELLNHYGQTEFMAGVGVYKCFEKVPEISLGKPCPKSNIVFKGYSASTYPNVYSGYEMWFNLKDYPIGLATNFKGDDEYYSGDIVFKDDKGFLIYYSRKDDIINSSAYRFSTTEVEKCINEIDGVEECSVIGVPDVQRGQIVKAIVVLKNKKVHNFKFWEDTIKKYVKTHLAPYKYPRIVEFMEELPKTASGKIEKRNLN